MNNYAEYMENLIRKQVHFLVDLKADVLASGKDGKLIGGCGYLAAARRIDECASALLAQQTQIEDLKNRLKIEREENAEYHRLVGDLDELYPSTDEEDGET